MMMPVCLMGATNPANFGLLTIAPKSTTAIGRSASGQLEDITRIGGAIVFGVKVNKALTLEAGYGIIKDEVKVDAIKYETEISTYYINCSINIAPGFVIIPEYGMMDLGDDKETDQSKTKLGDCKYFAAKLQLNF